MTAKRRYRRIFYLFLTAVLAAALGYFGCAAIRSRIPSRILVSRMGEQPDLFHNAFDRLIVKEQIETGADNTAAEAVGVGTVLDAANELGSEKNTAEMAVNAGQTGSVSDSYQISYSLFGKIPLKTVSASVRPRSQVYAGGSPIGIYLETDGVFVVETGDITTGDGSTCCPAENIVRSGDYIQAINGEAVTTKEELIDCITKCGGDNLVLDVERGGERIALKIEPVLDQDGSYRAGIWVRNDTQGIGTLTYVTQEGDFGALGHGISDIDTGELLDIRSGTLYEAEVLSIIKGTQGVPGELSGIIRYSEGYQIGRIRENRRDGIYGTVSGLPDLVQEKELYETAYRQEITPGPATVLCSVNGVCQEYEVQIREVRLNGKDVNKGMVIEVTDPELLSLTGGVVQGMSGSPLKQNGRIIGAVTHVFVNDPTKGYGIFIEKMLEH